MAGRTAVVGLGRRAVLAAAIAGGAAGLVVSPGHAVAPLSFSVVNGTVNAGADRLQAGSDAFPNFRSGAFDNYYPMAHSHVDGSPASQATASPVDTGPLGQAVASGTFGTPPFPQPQYANAVYPPGTSAPVSVGSPGGPYAAATAGANTASAVAEFASSGPAATPAAVTAAAPRGTLTRLDVLLSAWRAEYLAAAAAARYPAVHPDASVPDGVTGGTAQTAAAVDGSKGLVLSATAHAQAASFAGGAIRIGGVDVTVTSDNAGTPSHSVSVDVGSVSVGGVPVHVDHDGVSVDTTKLPGVGLAVDQANAALNQVLSQAGYQLTTLSPTITRSANQETIDAAGLEVQYAQPAVAPGVPRQEFVHEIGDVFVDSLAVPGASLAGGTTGGASSPAAGSSPATIFVPGTPGTPGTAGTPVGGSAATPAASGVAAATPPPAANPPVATALAPRLIAHRSKPVDLVLLYFLWQSLIIGTVAALWWRRLGTTGVAR